MNIAELLKYCPKGTKLYSSIIGEVILDKIDINEKFPIIVHKSDGKVASFTKEGCYIDYPDSECVLFPSKDQRDWYKFRLPVKKGGIMMLINGTCPFIATGKWFNTITPEYICGIDSYDEFKIHSGEGGWASTFYIPASEEAKKKLFDKMEEAGYKWNADTLELEKIEPMYKEGDVVIDDQGSLWLISKIRNDGFITVTAAMYTNKALNVYTSNTITRCAQLVNLASITDRNKLYSALIKKGYKYNKEQHRLIKQEFKPFDKVLVRDRYTDPWKAEIYLDYTEENKWCRYKCTRQNYRFCIPYEDNEYLLDTADSPM